MNLTGRPVYAKGQARTKRNPSPTSKHRKHWERVRATGCIICQTQAEIHHCETGAGGRKDHMKVLPLCFNHHRGHDGIHTIGRPIWQEKYGSEKQLMMKLASILFLPSSK